MVNLDVNRRPGYSLVLRENTYIIVTGAATVYRISPGKEPITLEIVTSGNSKQIGPFADLYSLMVVTNTNATVSDAVMSVSTGAGTVKSIVGGSNISVDNSDPANPKISASGELAANWDTLTNKPADLAVTGDITSARSTADLRIVSANTTINLANHLGKLVASDAATGVTVTLASDLPVGASGTILQAAAGQVTVATGAVGLTVPSGYIATTNGIGSAVQWVKLPSGIFLFGALANAA